MLHQLVAALRAGAVAGHAFAKVISVGHSFGSQVVAWEAGTVPVLLAVGQQDMLFCDATVSCADSRAILAREAGDFSSAACLEAYVLPTAGHSLNLHLNAQSWFAAASDWADRRVGTATGPPPQGCS